MADIRLAASASLRGVGSVPFRPQLTLALIGPLAHFRLSNRNCPNPPCVTASTFLTRLRPHLFKPYTNARGPRELASARASCVFQASASRPRPRGPTRPCDLSGRGPSPVLLLLLHRIGGETSPRFTRISQTQSSVRCRRRGRTRD